MGLKELTQKAKVPPAEGRSFESLPSYYYEKGRDRQQVACFQAGRPGREESRHLCR